LAQETGIGIASRRKRRTLIVIAGLATLAYLGAACALDSARIVAAVQQLDWFGCGLVLALSGANYAIRFQRWQRFMTRLGHRLPFGRQLLYYLSGFAFTVSPAKAGEAVRSLYLRGYGVTYSQSIAALFVERLQDLLAMVLLASLVVSNRPAYRPLVGGALLLVLAMHVLASRGPLPAALERLRSAFRQRRVVALLTAGANLLRSSRSLLQPRLLALGTAASVAAWGAEGLGYFLICRGLHIDVSLRGAVGIYALAVLAGTAAFFLPAGLGGMELVMTTLLVAQGAPLRLALAATLLCRLTTLWFAVLIGMAAATVVEMGPQRARMEAAP
jgi:glycosyltransferase 2 family protein